MTDIAHLGLAVDSAPVAKAAGDLDRISAAAKRAEQAATGMSDRVSAAGRRVEASNTAVASSANRVAASMSRMSAPISQIEASYDRAALAAKRFAAANDNLGRYRRQNLTYQLFDVGQMAALGQNPAMLLMQQGPQIAQIYAGNGGVNAAFKDLGTILGGIVTKLGPLALVAGVVAAGFFGLQQAIQDATGEAVSFGDTFKAVFQVIGGYIYDELEPAITAIAPYFEAAWEKVKEYTADAFNFIVASTLTQLEIVKAGAGSIYESFSAAYQSIEAVWRNLPAILGDIAMQAAQAVVGGTEDMVNGAIHILNKLIDAANLVGAGIERIGDVDFGELMNPWAGATEQTADEVVGIWSTALDRIKKMFGDALIAGQEFHSRDFAGGFFDDLSQQAVKNMEERLRDLKKEAKDAKDAAAELKRQFDAFQGRADNLLAKYFPGEAARREAHELIGLLDQFGDRLDDFQRSAVDARIDEMFLAAALGVRELNDETRKGRKNIDDMEKEARRLEDALKDAASNFLQDLFTGKGVLESIVQLGSRFASMNFDAFVDGIGGLLGGGAKPVAVNTNIPVAKAAGQAMGSAAAPIIAKTISDYVAAGGPGAGFSAPGRPVEVSLSTVSASKVQQAGNAFLDLIGRYEGTDKGRGYNESLGYGAFTGGNRNLIGMTLDQIDALQTSMLRHTANTFNSSALGRFQIVRQTLRGLKEEFNLSGDTLFTPKLQDELALQLARARGSNPDNLRNEWAGLKLAPDSVITEAYRKGIQGQTEAITDAVQTGSASGTQTGAAKGVETGVLKLGNMSSDQPGGAAGSSSGGFNMQGAMGLLSAGLGGFSTGYQSANPGMGLLGGAVQGFGAGMQMTAVLGSIAGPIGAVVGGIAGLIGGLMGARNKLKQAKRELEKNMNAINNLLAVGEGRGIGVLQKQLSDYLGEIDKAVSLAWKARNFDLVDRLHESWNIMFDRLSRDLYDALPGQLSAYSSGYGTDSPLYQGAKALRDLREELRTFIADVTYFGEQTRDAPLNETNKQWWLDNYGQERWEEEVRRAQAVYDETTAAANEAAKKMILAFIGGRQEFTEYESAVQAVQGAVAAAQTALEELGMTARAAAEALDKQLTAAIKKLQSAFIDDISASLYELSDLGYFNDLLDAQKRYNDRLRDAAALGLSADLANRELALSLRNIVKEAKLTDDQIRQLAAAMPELSASLMGLIGAGDSVDTGQALADAQAKVEDAKAALRSAYERERSEIESTISRLKSFTEGIRDFRDSLKLDKQLSPLSPYERLMEAQRQFNEVSAKALGGDEGAQGRLEEVSRAYLEEARAYYASSEAYFQIFEQVEATLDQALAKAEGQLSAAEKQLSALEKQVKGLIDIDDGVKSVGQAIKDLHAAQAEEATARAADDAYKNSVFAEMLAVLKAQLAAQQAAQAAQATAASASTAVYSQNDPVANAYRKYLGREPDASGYAYYSGMLNSGTVGMSEIDADIKKHAQDAGIYKGYASGGYTGDLGMGQVAGIVHGREFVMNAMATERWRPQFEAMNRGTWPSVNDNSALVAVIRAMDDRMAKMLERLIQIEAVSARENVQATREGTQAVRDQARESEFRSRQKQKAA